VNHGPGDTDKPFEPDPGAGPVTVAIVDDQALVREGLRRILETDAGIRVIAEAADGLEALDAVSRSRPDVAVLDVRMPRLDGIAGTRRILAEVPDPPRILILTTFGEDEYVYDALRAGASGFILKDAPPEELIAAVKVVSSGDALLDPAVTRGVIEEFVRHGGRKARPAPELEQLTPREREVLELIARGRSNAEIAEALVVSQPTVKTHVAHVLMKLAVRDRAQAVIYAYESGLVTPGEALRD
jgi:DNA-binding NarL/FixJ family response regulator